MELEPTQNRDSLLWEAFKAGFCGVYGRDPVIGLDCYNLDAEIGWIENTHNPLVEINAAAKHGAGRAVALVNSLTESFQQ
jgi:hypothetical protein